MIEEVLEQIKIAEEKANSRREEADKYLMDRAKQSEQECDAILSDAQNSIKSLKAQAKLDCAKKCDNLYNEVISAAKTDAEIMYNAKLDKIEQLAQDIVRKVLNGNL